MASLDDSLGQVAIGVVYDGPPRAGKTTSVRALAALLGREARTPEEADGRTVYFDWLEYVAGSFDDCVIRCQIITVPGQPAWAERRQRLVDLADVVVFVGDTSPAGWPESLKRLAALRASLDRRPAPPVGIVFQANKRDLPDAVPVDKMRAELADAARGIAIVESIASDGVGVRECFVFGVRLALDRVRELKRAGALAAGAPTFADDGQLLAHLKRRSRPTGLPTFRALLRTPGRPRPPTIDVPSDLIWPPVEGRLTLHEAAGGAEIEVRPTGRGDWFAGMGRPWRIHSSAGAVYPSLDEGRAALVAWAKQHARCRALLSSRRCLVLADTGDGRWRLWQLLRTHRPLRDLVAEKLVSASVPAAVPLLAGAARLVLEAELAARPIAPRLRCTLDTVGRNEAGRPIYVALMASPHEPAPASSPGPAELAEELATLVRACLPGGRTSEWRRALDQLGPAFAFRGGEAVSRSLREILSP